MCDIWCVYRFDGLIDGCSALGVVYNVSLVVVMTIRAGWSGSAGIAIWRARLFAAHLRVGAWSSHTYNLCWDEISFIVKLNWVIYLYYTTGNLSDIDHNANNEANGPFKWIYVIIRTYFCWIHVYIIIGLRKVIASPYKPDWGRSPIWPCGVYWILLIMLNMRRMDLSCVYM